MSRYLYQPLENSRHFRLLKIHPEQTTSNYHPASETFCFEVVHAPLEDAPTYETVSYAWGDSQMCETIQLMKGQKMTITKTENIALPYLASASTSGYLWMEQLCIDQLNVEEQSQQVSIMSDIYKTAKRVLIWLGKEGESTTHL
jgi:hypothetical protein